MEQRLKQHFLSPQHLPSVEHSFCSSQSSGLTGGCTQVQLPIFGADTRGEMGQPFITQSPFMLPSLAGPTSLGPRCQKYAFYK